MEKKVLTEEELQKLKKFQEKENEIIVALGQIAYQQENLDEQKDQIKQTKKEFDKMRADFAAGLTKKYGDGLLNTETGEITPQK
jgi:predicted site-specific integrase-resolvase